MLIRYAILFVFFSIFGWLLDTSYRSFIDKKFSYATKIPFLPEYGVGGEIMFVLYSMNFNPVMQVILVGFLFSVVEYVFGVFYKKILNKRLWDYRKNKFNLQGYVDFLHSVYWFVLAFILKLAWSVVQSLLLS